MNENSNIVPLRQPDEIDDPLTNILRSGARQLLAQAVEMEAEAFLAAMNGLKLPDGRDRLVPPACQSETRAQFCYTTHFSGLAGDLFPIFETATPAGLAWFFVLSLLFDDPDRWARSRCLAPTTTGVPITPADPYRHARLCYVRAI